MSLLTNKDLYPQEYDTDTGSAPGEFEEKQHNPVMIGNDLVCVSCPYLHTLNKIVARK